MIEFGTEARPLRPSSLDNLLACPMSVLLTLGMASEGNAGSNTGSVVHAGVEGFHRGGESVTAGEEAMAEALPKFPEADWGKAYAWYQAYAADPTNRGAIARLEDGRPAVEVPVRINYKGVWIAGTLDQVRLTDGVLSVWDLKTGSGFLSPEDTVAEHQAQQAAYVLAARATLKLDIQPGGIIYAVGYDKPRGRRFIPMGVTLKQCEELLDEVVARVAVIRDGGRSFIPSAAACKFCKLRTYPSCTGNTSDATSPA